MKKPNISQRLRGKVAIVTGAGSSGPGVGTGKAISILLAREGAKVLLVDYIEKNAKETMKQITSEGGCASIFCADITKSKMCNEMVKAVLARYGKLDILINNVGILSNGSIGNSSDAEWKKTMDVNVKGSLLTCKYAVPAMVRNNGGSIINMASVDALRGGTSSARIPYSASKGAIISMSKAMAVQYGRSNIRVNCIAPGLIYTPMVSGYLTDELRNLRRESSPLGSEGTAWDVAAAALFLSSDEARWITGTVLPVDGGLLACTPLSMFPHLQSIQLESQKRK